MGLFANEIDSEGKAMYKILIVDDEKREREGIKKLLTHFQFKFAVEQARNGEEALEIMEKQNFDVLLTDIKMPFMDGIELIGEVRKRGWNPVCIIYSAYGEFEYARKAISLGVSEYLLKPIQLDVFQKQFQKVFQICEEKAVQKAEAEHLQNEYSELINYKRKKNLLSFLDGELQELSEEEAGIDFGKQDCIPVLISAYSNLFTKEWEFYQNDMRKVLQEELLILHKEDHQLLVLIIMEKEKMNANGLNKQCEEFLKVSRKKYQTDIFMVVGSKVSDMKALKKEYVRIQDQLDYQFFVSESSFLVHDKMYMERREQDMLTLYFERIFNNARLGDITGMKTEFQKVFAYIEGNTGFSSIYIKYTFTDAVKQIWEYTGSTKNIMTFVEKIYETRSFEELSTMIHQMLDELCEEQIQECKENRLVRLTKNHVAENYKDCNLGVSVIAEQLNVANAYLSSLFKMETGENLNKFIMRYRMEKAKSMLLQSNMKIGDIAAAVGYTNSSYFISVFKSYEGCSPVQFRERDGK